MDVKKVLENAGKNVLVNVGRNIIYASDPATTAEEYNKRIMLK